MGGFGLRSTAFIRASILSVNITGRRGAVETVLVDTDTADVGCEVGDDGCVGRVCSTGE